jgi:hypothetical protein
VHRELVAGKPKGLRILEQLQKDFPQDTFLHFITIPSARKAKKLADMRMVATLCGVKG